MCRSWRIIFSGDTAQEPIAKKLGYKKLESNPIFQSLQNHSIKPERISRSLLDRLQGSYEDNIREIHTLEEENIRKSYPKAFLELFDNVNTIKKLPKLELKSNDLIQENNNNNIHRISYYFKEEHFSAPIVRAIVTKKDNSKIHFFLFRVQNNQTNTTHREAIHFYNLYDELYFGIDYTRPVNRAICPNYSKITEAMLDRIGRFIQKQTVGILAFNEVEGPRTTPNGQSTLELI